MLPRFNLPTVAEVCRAPRSVRERRDGPPGS
jgi:hypothetical protein